MRSAAHNQSRKAQASGRTRRVRVASPESRLVRLGVVYADSLRLTILTELWMREMSPSQFFDEVGGSSLNSVRKHFERLEKFSWLRRVRQRSEGPGRPEWVYRTTELAVIDEATWSEIPPSIRDAFTLQLMQQLSERLGLAMEAQTLQAHDDDQVFALSSPMALDESGWQQGLRILSDCLQSLEMEQTDAKVRLADQGRPPILMIVAMAGFESPMPNARLRPSRLPPSSLQTDPVVPWTIRLAKLFGDPISMSIVSKLNEKPMSPIQLEAAIGGASSQGFDRRCKLLVELGWAAQVPGTGGGDGTRRVLYRATSPAVEVDRGWAIIPERLRRGDTWTTYRQLCELVFDAVRFGTLNARIDRHLTWGTLLLDDLGRDQVVQTLRESVRSLTEVERAAKRRIDANTGGFPATFFVGGFVSPPLNKLPIWGDLEQLAPA
jgi:hypothetical protein